ncbi:MAG TPA: thioesterase family protein [Phycisphaerales bacterium]|nr:thioesterase family protein [Phycisphaerales bacterium]
MSEPFASLPRPPRPPALSGEITLRPRYCECDPMGVAHHASYVPWLEIGRTELLRDCGLTYAKLESYGVLLVIVKLEVRYRRAIRYDDLIRVRTTVTGGSRVKLDHAYEISLIEPAAGWPAGELPAEPQLLAVASTTLAAVDRAGKPHPLPDWLVAARHAPA